MIKLSWHKTIFLFFFLLIGSLNQAFACGSIVGSIGAYKVGDIHVSGFYAYFSDQNGFKIVDVRNPVNPVVTGEVPIGAYCGKFDISETYAYILEGRITSIWPEIKTLPYLNIVDISDDQNPVLVSSIKLSDEPYYYLRDIRVSGSYAYIVTGDRGMKVFNISNPQSPSPISSVSLDSSWASSINISGTYAFVGTLDNGLKILDISNPERPTIVASVDIYGPFNCRIVGKYLYAATGNLEIFDISNPQNPFQVGFTATPKIAVDVSATGSYVFVADSSDAGGNTLMIDNSDFDNPQTICSIESEDGPSAVFATDSYVYAGDDIGFYIIEFDLLRKPSLVQFSENNHWYKAFEYLKRWGDAKFYCEALGGYLATLTSVEENYFIYNNLIKYNNSYWLGATDEINEGTWQWVSGEDWIFSNWSENQPDNRSPGQNYLCSNFLYPYKWDDNGLPRNNDEFYYICEWDDLDDFTIITRKTDIDENKFTNGVDLSIFNYSFGSEIGSPEYNENADFNEDGIIDQLDLIAFAYMFGKEYGKHEIIYTDGFAYPINPPDAEGWDRTQKFNNYNTTYGGYHLGEDWINSGGDTENQNVNAVANGVIVHSEVGGGCWLNVIIIRHTLPDGSQFESLYGHLNSRNYGVGDFVAKGSVIGTIGNPDCGGPHLHFEIRTPDCPHWDTHVRDDGYSDVSAPAGWLDPTTFINSH